VTHSYTLQLRPNGLNGWVGRLRRSDTPDEVLLIDNMALPGVMKHAEDQIVIDCQKTGKPDFDTPQSALTGLSEKVADLLNTHDLWNLHDASIYSQAIHDAIAVIKGESNKDA
jgi:hypothetical protein